MTDQIEATMSELKRRLEALERRLDRLEGSANRPPPMKCHDDSRAGLIAILPHLGAVE